MVDIQNYRYRLEDQEKGIVRRGTQRQREVKEEEEEIDFTR